jgi:hypothetical protein
MCLWSKSRPRDRPTPSNRCGPSAPGSSGGECSRWGEVVKKGRINANVERPTSNVQRPTSKCRGVVLSSLRRWKLDVGRSTFALIRMVNMPKAINLTSLCHLFHPQDFFLHPRKSFVFAVAWLYDVLVGSHGGFFSIERRALCCSPGFSGTDQTS